MATYTKPRPHCRLKEVCRHCGKLFLKASARGAHEGKCSNIGVSLPDGRDRCRKCGLELQHRSVRSHEALCRGSHEQNTHCQNCGLRIDFSIISRPRTMPQMWHAVREKPVPAHPKVQVIRVGQTYMSKLRPRVWQLGFTSRSRTQVQSIVPHPGWSQLYGSPFVWYCVAVTFSCWVL